ncbi:phage tail assembly protein [Robbsia andropogonis]|uniref:phage tail assembly protein n=1 Tax=Robbsia andropogonis TaxID=28092 RepID=UPI00209CABFA|nr:phage tail assembly protein [Robbsia andropogonis]MCP1116935.1 phage tail assembly protein [Robbsia andropogonis]MCP1126386.1 phage tail assembly protein [Robbsia andropogonis]
MSSDTHSIDDTTAHSTPDPLRHDLDTPLQRGDQRITAVTLRRPNAGALRGTALTDLATLNVAALQKVLPRISTPTLTEQDVANLDPADLIQLGGIFAGFLLTKAERLKADLPIA